MSQNEQFTESLTRKLMGFEIGQNDGYYVHPQSIDSSFFMIRECLNKAGGKPANCSLDDYPNETKGIAKPEYIITFDEKPNTIVVIECKKSKKDHISNDLSHPQKYAVDGVLYYAKFLKNEFNVIAIAVSGTNAEDFFSNSYYWEKGRKTYEEIKKTCNILITPNNYINLLEKKKLVKKFSINEIKQNANKYNELMRETLKIPAQERIIFVATCLLALQDKHFINSYPSISDNSILTENIISSVKRVLKNNKIPDIKIQQIVNNSQLIKNYQKLLELNPQQEGSLFYFLRQFELSIIPMINDSLSHQDALGIFYHEFIKYTAGNTGRELGIVLTPEHLCDFMCELANIGIKDTILDICCGTGSFLVSAMKHLIEKAKNSHEIENIKNKQLFGIEVQPTIYSIAITNMILRGDGQSNIYNEDCMQYQIPLNVNFSVGLLNPPYSQKQSELVFLKKMLDLLSPRGTGVVVIPMSCLIRKEFRMLKKELFESHTLKAVFSMPNDIFYPVGTNVCVMVWEAHKPHDSKNTTFFGYCKDDGFVKRKKLGRIDANNKWQTIKEEWLRLYRENKELAGKSILHKVTYQDECLCEAYMKTDYSKLTQSDFEKTIKYYFAYKIITGQ